MSFIPDVFVIGAMKAGTTTLWKVAAEHPSLESSKSKEVNYFTAVKSIEMLEELYGNQYVKHDALKLDVSPNYSKRHIYPGVAERIYKANPKAKIIYLVRNPIDRIVSHLQHDMYRGRLKKDTIDKELFDNKDYIRSSMYYYQLEEYLHYFAQDAILVMELETMHKNQEAFWSDIFSFLSVQSIPMPAKSYNIAEKRYLIPYHDVFHRTVHNALLGKVYHLFWYSINIKLQRPKLNTEVLSRIKPVLQPDALKLQEQFGIPTIKWFTERYS